MANDRVYRVLDANFNRAKEALRVCEDITRFILNQDAETRQYRKIRHNVEDVRSLLGSQKKRMIKARNVCCDIGKRSVPCEFKRSNVNDIFFANSQRAKESLRVLEEFLKLTNKKAAEECKKNRYCVYALERKVFEKL